MLGLFNITVSLREVLVLVGFFLAFRNVNPLEFLNWNELHAQSDQPGAESTAKSRHLHGKGWWGRLEHEAGPVIGSHEVSHVKLAKEDDKEPPVSPASVKDIQ